jgi:hypothetical protein
MHVFLKSYYLLLFISLDVLLYLRLSQAILKTEFWLKIVIGILVITFIAHLPFFHLPGIMDLKTFATLFGMDIQLLIVYFVGVFTIKRVERRMPPDKVKDNGLWFLKGFFKTGIFLIYPLVHTLWVIAWR